MASEWVVFKKDEFEDGRKALVEYWNSWLARYMGLWKNEPDSTIKAKVIPPGYAGFRINILLSPSADGFLCPDVRHSYDIGELLRFAANPTAYNKRTMGVVQQTYAETKSDVGVFVYYDPEQFPTTSHPLSYQIFSDAIIVDGTDPNNDAERLYRLRTSPLSQLYHHNLLTSALKERDPNVKGKKLEKLLRGIFEEIKGFKIISSNIKTRDEEIDIVVENESVDYPWHRESPLILIECKNWVSRKIGANEFKLLMQKIENRFGRAKVGFLIGTHSFTSTINTEMLRHSKKDILIVPIDGKQLRELATEPDKNRVLRKFYLIAAMT